MQGPIAVHAIRGFRDHRHVPPVHVPGNVACRCRLSAGLDHVQTDIEQGLRDEDACQQQDQDGHRG